MTKKEYVKFPHREFLDVIQDIAKEEVKKFANYSLIDLLKEYSIKAVTKSDDFFFRLGIVYGMTRTKVAVEFKKKYPNEDDELVGLLAFNTFKICFNTLSDFEEKGFLDYKTKSTTNF